MTGPGSFDRASDRERVGALLGVLVGALVILVAFSLWLPPARAAEAQSDPAQVTGVSASADDQDSITASWNAVTSTCGSDSLYYEVRWDDDSGFASPQDEKFIPDTTDSYQITGLGRRRPRRGLQGPVAGDGVGRPAHRGDHHGHVVTIRMAPPTSSRSGAFASTYSASTRQKGHGQSPTARPPTCSRRRG